MDSLNNARLKEIMQTQNDTCISIYLPTYKKGAEVEQNSIRFKNTIRETEKLLKDRGYRKHEIDDMLNPARNLINDHTFWNNQDEGLALFIAPNVFYNFRAPTQFSEQLIINNRFYVKPILPSVHNEDKFFVLSLDKKHLRLYEGNHSGLKEIELNKIPVNFEQEVEDYQTQHLWFNTSQRGANRPSIYNGPGFGTDDARESKDLRKFFQRINKGLNEKLKLGNPPLILAGVEYLHPHFKNVSTYQNILPKAVTANTGHMSEKELFDRSWEIAKEHFESSKEDLIFHYEQLYDSGRTSNNIVEIIPAAFSNRIQILFVNPDNCIWGKFDQESYKLELHEIKQEGDEDLCDLAISQALLHNAEVINLNQGELPEADPLAAIFRY